MRELTYGERECITYVKKLNVEIEKLQNDAHDALDALIGANPDMTIEDIEFWISVLPPGFHRTELRVLLNEKLKG